MDRRRAGRISPHSAGLREGEGPGYVAIPLRYIERIGHRDNAAESRMNSHVTLSGKVLVVTGSDGALGQAVVATLSRYGARVALLAHGPKAVSSAAARLAALWRRRFDPGGGRAGGDGARLAKEAGRLDGLINIAGGFHWEKIAGSTLDTWDSMYRSEPARPPCVAVQAALPYLPQGGGGRVVNVGADGRGQGWRPGMGAYAASKAGVCEIDRGSRRRN